MGRWRFSSSEVGPRHTRVRLAAGKTDMCKGFILETFPQRPVATASRGLGGAIQFGQTAGRRPQPPRPIAEPLLRGRQKYRTDQYFALAAFPERQPRHLSHIGHTTGAQRLVQSPSNCPRGQALEMVFGAGN